MLVLANDKKSFTALERINKEQKFTLKENILSDGQNIYTFLGISADPKNNNLKSIKVYQEYWHSWRTFHPMTLKQL